MTITLESLSFSFYRIDISIDPTHAKCSFCGNFSSLVELKNAIRCPQCKHEIKGVSRAESNKTGLTSTLGQLSELIWPKGDTQDKSSSVKSRIPLITDSLWKEHRTTVEAYKSVESFVKRHG